MYDIYYVGAQNNEKINFCQWPYMVTGGDLFDGDYDPVEENEHIQEFERKITDKSLKIDINAVGNEFCQAVDYLENVAEKDIIHVTPGKLYVGNSYLKCWLTGTKKDRWVNDLDGITNEIIIRSDYPYWINEEKFSFLKQSQSGVALPWLEYPHDYPYEYAKEIGRAHV